MYHHEGISETEYGRAVEVKAESHVLYTVKVQIYTQGN